MHDPSALIPLIDRLAGARILCIGDVMLDEYLYGRVERISPEAPIPVLKVERETAMLGGAGNVVRNLTALGARCRFVSVIGKDVAGEKIRALLKADQRVRADLVEHRDRLTTIKTRHIGGAQQLLRADREDAAALDGGLADRLIKRIQTAMKDVQAVVLSDYGKGVISKQVAQAAIRAARKAGIPVIVDPKGVDYARYQGAFVVTPNRTELSEAAGLPAADDASIVRAAKAVMVDAGIDNVLATRSQEGMSLIRAKGKAVHLPAQAREVFDVSGAGDTVVAVLSAALATGADLVDAAGLANAAAGIVVGKVGTAVVHGDELISALHMQDMSAAEQKIMSREALADRVDSWRSSGARIGFTNGVFDLLHPGHISLLKQARAACDRLIVAVNSDASVKRLKGDSRPVQNEAARTAVLASLAGVDAVVVFGEDTPLELIKQLRPDVLVKGADYRERDVVGADIVKKGGGKVVLARIEEGHSTTNTIARLGK